MQLLAEVVRARAPGHLAGELVAGEEPAVDGLGDRGEEHLRLLAGEPEVAKPARALIGIGLAIDDFGTRYSSLGYLRALPVEELKIDRSFVKTLGTHRDDEMIVQSTIDLGRNLGLRIVAEDIETEEVRRRLEELGCHLGQGYHYSAPVSGEDLAAWVAERSAGEVGLAA